MVPKTCLECGVVIRKGNRCVVHMRQYERNRSTNRVAYRDPMYLSFVKSNVCEFCGSTEDLTKDHKVPLSRGGTNHPSNLRTLCRSCNSAKRDKIFI